MEDTEDKSRANNPADMSMNGTNEDVGTSVDPAANTGVVEELKRFSDAYGGARPKSSTSTPGPSSSTSTSSEKTSLTFLIRYHTSFQDQGSYETGTLTIGSAPSLKFDGHYTYWVAIQDLRWITKYQYMEQPAKFCIIISIRDSFQEVKNLFISPCVQTSGDTADRDAACLNGTSDDSEFNMCYDLIWEMYQNFKFGDLAPPQQLSVVLPLISNQPIFQGHIDLVVCPVSGQRLFLNHQLMLLDVEFVVWYGKDLHKPEEQVAFWKDPSDISVETVKVFHADGKMQLETKHCAYVIPLIEEVQQNLKNLTPKRRHFMCDAQALLDVSSSMTMYTVPTPGGSTSQYGISGESDRYRPILQRENWDDMYRTDGSDGSMEFYQRQLGVKTYKGTLDEVKKSYFGIEEFELQWLTIKYDLEEIINAGEVPLSDAGSGGLDPNNGEHLEKAMSDVEDQMKDNDFRVALSRIEAVREMFKNSHVPWIREIFSETNIELLKCLYFKYLCT